MPTYEYKREDGSLFEFFQGMNDKPLETCPETGQKVKRMISGGGGVVYKGTGFYITDYKNGNGNGKQGKANTSEPKSENKEPAGSSPKSEE
ncbi:MAG: zinc ribbon domain-containing protein [Balneolaceae bacterium]|nr:MAG: zinc ribbon domain-containing protein [Balneolaceae bacterium]